MSHDPPTVGATASEPFEEPGPAGSGGHRRVFLEEFTASQLPITFGRYELQELLAATPDSQLRKAIDAVRS